jgi:hypothetical protein
MRVSGFLPVGKVFYGTRDAPAATVAEVASLLYMARFYGLADVECSCEEWMDAFAHDLISPVWRLSSFEARF